MPKTRTAPPAKRTKEPTHDLARQGPDNTSGHNTPAGPMTDRTTKPHKDEIKRRGNGSGEPSSDNARAAERRGGRRGANS